MRSEEIARAIVSGSPPDWRRLGNPAQARLNRYWTELSNLARGDSWRSVMATSGQIVEGLVKHRLMAADHKDVDRKTLGQLLALAHKTGTLEASTSYRLAASTLSAALILRNWSSHFSAHARDPDVTQAAQALTLLIAASEALYPTEVQGDAYGASALSTINSALTVILTKNLSGEDQIAALANNPKALADYYVMFAGPSKIAVFEEVLRTRGLSTDSLKDSLSENFSQVVRVASRSSFGQLLKLLLVMRRVGLETHASVAGILLPSEPKLLAKLVEDKSRAWLGMYLAECHKASRGLISARLGNPKKRAPLVEALSKALGSKEGNITNLGTILQYLPVVVREEALSGADQNALLVWAESSLLTSNMRLLFSFYAHSPIAKVLKLQERLIETVLQGIAAASALEVSRLPLLLSRRKVVDASLSRRILLAAIARIEELKDWPSIRRTMWDIYCFFPELASIAINETRRMVGNDHLNIPVWERLCLIGMLSLAGVLPPRNMPYLVEQDRSARIPAVPSEADRWQGFLFAVGAAVVGGGSFVRNLSPDFIKSIRSLVASTTVAEIETSKVLLQATKVALVELSNGSLLRS